MTEQSVTRATVLLEMPVCGCFLPPVAEPGEPLPSQFFGLRLDLRRLCEATDSYRRGCSVHGCSSAACVVRGCYLKSAAGIAGRPA